MNQRRLFSAITLLAIATGILTTGNVRAQTPGVAPQVLTIDDAVSLALERNLSLTSAQSRVETSGIRVTTAFGEFLPTIQFTGSYNKQLNEGTAFLNGVPLGTNQPDNSLYANASANLLIFDGFRRTAAYNAAQSTFGASVQTLNRTREDVAFQTRAAFLDALRTEQIIEVRRSDLELNREQLARTRGLVEAGAAQIGNVYSQESEVANAELSLEQAITDVTIAGNKLSLLLNLDPTTRVTLSSAGLLQSVDSVELASARLRIGSRGDLFQRQVAKRPDILAARLQVEAATSSVKAATSGYYPSVTSSLGYSWQRSAQAAGPITSSNAQFTLGFQYTAFDGFRVGEQVQLAEAQRQTAEIELRQLELQARSDLDQSLARLDGAERQLRAAEKAVAAARQSRFASDERYKVGVGSYSDYLLANNQFLTSQINQVNAVFNYRLAIYEIQYLTGE